MGVVDFAMKSLAECPPNRDIPAMNSVIAFTVADATRGGIQIESHREPRFCDLRKIGNYRFFCPGTKSKSINYGCLS